jgi:FkbM family methyltransferase
MSNHFYFIEVQKTIIMLNTFLKLLPFKKALVQYGASLKLKFRNPIETKIYGKLASFVALQGEADVMVGTNLGIADKYKVVLPLGKTPTEYIFGTPENYYGERTVLYLSKYLAKNCDAIADIGANWGFYSYFLAAHTDKKIYFFEPNKELFDNILMNIKANYLQDRLIGSSQGIAEKTGQLDFYVNLSSNYSSSLSNYFENVGHHIVKTTIEVISVDDFVKKHEHKNWLLKVDIEDAEFQFLEGAEQALKQGKVKYLIIELLQNARKNNFVDKMIAKGWNAYYLNDYRVEFVSKEDGRYTPPEYNWLFCKEKPEELKKILNQTRFVVVG